MKAILQDINLCYGCSACYYSCPVGAISMIRNKKGYLIPEINDNCCVDCGICKRTCPRLNISIEDKHDFEVFAAKNKEDSVRNVSQSGGVFWPICEYVFSKHGVVYGCSLDSSNKKAIHIRATSLAEVIPFHGAKYIQSDLGDAFKNIKNDLAAKLLVLFVGTPCQVAGLKSFIGKDDPNLLTIDLVCFGVSSPMIWKGYVDKLESIYKGECLQAKFRDKKYGWQSHFSTVVIKKSNERIISIKDTTFRNIFIGKYANRDSCFSCQFRSINRVGDLTLGDCWGIEETKYKDFADDKGVSLLIINNNKAWNVINNISAKLEYRKLTQDEASQPALISQYNIPKGRDKFWNKYYKSGVDAILIKYGSWKYRVNCIVRGPFSN